MSYKLLLADDSVTIQRVIELTFADEDIAVTAVGDGRQAIERITAERPDIVLADVGMPERDGFEVAAFVKQNPDLCSIPVLLLTGAFEPVDDARVQAAGVEGVLAKPFEPQLLIARVKELLMATSGKQVSMAAAGDGRVRTPVLSEPEPKVPVESAALQPVSPQPPPDSLDDMPLSTATPDHSRAAVDEYFDRLDAAFANLTGPGGTSIAQNDEGPDDNWAPKMTSDAAWPAPPVGPASAEPEVPPTAPSRPAPLAVPVPVMTGAPAEIAAAFEWVLAAEQGRPVPADAVPVTAASRSIAMDTVVEEITRRVIERLADRGVHDQVADIVSKIAERLVREEIDRLKAGLK